MKNIILTLSTAFFIQTVFAGIPTLTEFPFQRDITVSSTGQTEIFLEESLLNEVNEKFSNFDIFDENNNEVPFSLFFKDFNVLKNTKVVDVSSQKESLSQYLIDDNVFTTFRFDEKTDGKDPSWALIDLGEMRPINQLKIFTPETGMTIRYIEILGGKTKDDLKTIFSKRSFATISDFASPEVRFVKVLFWGTNVKIDDIRITASARAKAYFNAEKQKNYKILYGGEKVDLIRYQKRITKEAKAPLFGILSKQKANPIAPKDFDNDGFDSENDNCPFLANPSQKDTDGDRVGDECDNAKDIKNSRQIDTDRDGVGDILDNCKFDANADQSNVDNDQFGDVCDNVNMKAKLNLSANILYVISFLGILLSIGGGWFFLKTRKK
jgi:hypothetical protein